MISSRLILFSVFMQCRQKAAIFMTALLGLPLVGTSRSLQASVRTAVMAGNRLLLTFHGVPIDRFGTMHRSGLMPYGNIALRRLRTEQRTEDPFQKRRLPDCCIMRHPVDSTQGTDDSGCLCEQATVRSEDRRGCLMTEIHIALLFIQNRNFGSVLGKHLGNDGCFLIAQILGNLYRNTADQG